MDQVEGRKPAASGAANPLRRLGEAGQSVWLDFIRRSFIADGSLQRMVEEDGLRGVTSNPSIFEKAMGGGTDYDPQFASLAEAGDHDAQTIYETLAVDDIRHATDVLKPVYESTEGLDGYVSLEVSPYLALRTDETVTEARRLWAWVDRPNLMVKVPGTEAGVPAIRTLIGEGLSINVTLLFALSAYDAVSDAYLAGLEDRVARGEDISRISSVASFFVSRIDGMIDKRIDEKLKSGGPDEAALRAVRGKVAIANAKIAYQHYLEMTRSDRWQKLEAKGANPQRLLWASTGTKDKSYSDVLYVEELVGPHTVDTIPPATMDAFRDHGKVRPSLTEDLDGARRVLAEAERLGLDLGRVTEALVEDGVKQFADAADKLLGAVAAKRAKMLHDTIDAATYEMPDTLRQAVEAEAEAWRAAGKVRDLWAGEAALWTGEDEGQWLGWLRIVDERMRNLKELTDFQQDVKSAGFKSVLLLGMGGSSLGPEVLAETFGQRGGYPVLHVLDSTDPQQVAAFERKVDLASTLVVVSSKSGGTLEPNILKAYFFDRMKQKVGEKAGSHFVAVTDPGSHMQSVAEKDGFRKIFYGDKTIGGRYSVLSNFGLVPAAAIGLDLAQFLGSAQRMANSCAPSAPPAENPGVQLGLLLGVAGKHGRDKVTIVASPGLRDMGAWLEQLLAESTGKQGKGLVPVDDETLAAPGAYGQDRVFAYLRLKDSPDVTQDAAIKALAAAGHPVVTIDVGAPLQIGQEFFRWEFATAVAGAVLGINAFNQPDVEASKIATRKLTDAYAQSGSLPQETAFGSDGPFSFFADKANESALKDAGGSLESVLKAHLSRVGAGDYVALLAYIERNDSHRAALQAMRLGLRDRLHVATVGEFGPRFLHSTGQAYKGGPNSGVFLQITASDAADLAVPGERYSFGVVKAAQARGDFDVLAERGRRALRVHIAGDLASGLDRLAGALAASVA